MLLVVFLVLVTAGALVSVALFLRVDYNRFQATQALDRLLREQHALMTRITALEEWRSSEIGNERIAHEYNKRTACLLLDRLGVSIPAELNKSQTEE